MRWIACFVAEVHRILCRGGFFTYPKDDKNPDRPGKLRLMYEANPMSFLIEQAGGKATNGFRRIMEIQLRRSTSVLPCSLAPLKKWITSPACTRIRSQGVIPETVFADKRKPR